MQARAERHRRAAAALVAALAPLGFEPLCAGYDVRALSDVEDLIRTDGAGGRSMESALSRAGVHRIPASELGAEEELALAFTNVNTLETANLVEGVLRERHAPA